MKIPKAKKLSSGNWNVVVMVHGDRISVTAPTRRQAEQEAAAIKSGAKMAEKKTGLTVGEAIDRYIASKDAVLSPATVAGYKRIRAHALQDIMGLELDALTQERVQRSINAMAKDKSPKSVRNAHGLLSATLSVYRPGLVLRTTLPQKVRYEPSVPSGEDVRKIMEAARGTAAELPILLAVWLGLRMSEILGLRREDVDSGVLHIRRAVVDEGEKATKTYGSQRDLPLPDYLKGLLPERDGPLVPMTRRALYCRFQAVCRRAGVQHYRFHDLRHINASVMLAIGVPNKYAQERMGHSTDHMLQTVYQHTMSKEAQAVAKKVDAYFYDILQTKLQTEKAGP